jgi:hypothetical protein
MKHFALLVTSALALGLNACAPAAKKPAEAPAASTAVQVCPDDGPRLPITGLCRGRAVNYFDPARFANASGDLPEGCTWVVSETTTPDPNEAILYNALSCNGKTTQLEFSAGAGSASLSWGVSGFFDDVPTQGETGSERVRLFTLEGVADAKALILEMARGTAAEQGSTPEEVVACEMRPAGEGYPSDAFVVDVNDAYKQANKLGTYDGLTDGPEAGVYAACGPYGVTDAQVFWLIRDGYAWFLDQGQDMPDFDAGSLTVFRKAADGAWAPVG